MARGVSTSLGLSPSLWSMSSRRSIFARLLALSLAFSASGLVSVCALAEEWGVHDSERDQKIVDRLLVLLDKDPLAEFPFEQLRKQVPKVGGFKTLVDRYADALAKGGPSASALLLLARFHLELGEADRSVRYLDTLAELRTLSGPERLLRGIARAEGGDLDGAQVDFDAALSDANGKDEKLEILQELGQIARNQGREQDSIAYTQAILELSPKDAYLRWELGALFLEQGEFERALEQYQAAADLAGNNVEKRSRAELEVASILVHLERYDEAIETYEDLLAGVKSTHWLYRECRDQLVDAYERKGDIEGLLAYLDGRLKRDRKDFWALGRKADVLLSIGKEKEAAEAFAALAAQGGLDDDQSFQAYSALLERLDRRDALIALYTARIEGSKDEKTGVTALLDLAMVLSRGVDIPFESYTQLVKFEVRFKELSSREELARAYLGLGRTQDGWRRARALLEGVLEDDPQRIESYLLLLGLTLDEEDRPAEDALLERLAGLEGFDGERVQQIAALYTSRGRGDRVVELIDWALKGHADDLELRFLRAQNVGYADYATQLAEWRGLLLASDVPEHLSVGVQRYTELLGLFDLVGESLLALEDQWAREPANWRLGRLVVFLLAEQGLVEEAFTAYESIEGQLPAGDKTLEQVVRLAAPKAISWSLSLLGGLAERNPGEAWRYDLQAAELLRQYRSSSEQAVSYLERALEGAPDNAGAHHLAAELYAAFGEPTKAMATFERAVLLAPREPSFRTSLALFVYRDWAETGGTTRLSRGYEAALGGVSLAQDEGTLRDLLELTLELGRAQGLADGGIAEDLRRAADGQVQRMWADAVRAFAQKLPDAFAAEPELQW